MIFQNKSCIRLFLAVLRLQFVSIFGQGGRAVKELLKEQKTQLLNSTFEPTQRVGSPRSF